MISAQTKTRLVCTSSYCICMTPHRNTKTNVGTIHKTHQGRAAAAASLCTPHFLASQRPTWPSDDANNWSRALACLRRPRPPRDREQGISSPPFVTRSHNHTSMLRNLQHISGAGRGAIYARPTSFRDRSYSLAALASSDTSSDTWFSKEPVLLFQLQ